VKLAVTLIARDEAHRIGKCLERLGWVDEIVVVVDDRTTDKTAEIARRFTEHVHVRPFSSYSQQRQWADDQCVCEWVLWVDCDELVSTELAREIRAVLEAPRFAAYRIPRLDYVFGKWIRHGGWYPQFHIRLYRRDAGKWAGDVHESVTVHGEIGKVAQPIQHFSHAHVEDWVNKLARYTTLEAQSMRDRGVRMNVGRLLFEPPAYAFYKLIVQQGWRDGGHGLVLALLLGCYRMIRNLKLWDLQQSAHGPRESEQCPPPMSRP